MRLERRSQHTENDSAQTIKENDRGPLPVQTLKKVQIFKLDQQSGTQPCLRTDRPVIHKIRKATPRQQRENQPSPIKAQSPVKRSRQVKRNQSEQIFVAPPSRKKQSANG